MPPDPEEIQEIMAKMSGKSIRKPPQFMRMSIPLKMMSMTEPLDGVKFDLNLPVSQTFQAGFGFNFSNTKPSKFELTTVLSLVDPKKQGPFGNPDEMSMIQARSDSTGFLEVHSKFCLGEGYSISPEVFFMNNQVDTGMLQLELMKEWDTCHLVAKTMAGMQYSLSFMQALNKNLVTGFEFTYLPERRDSMFFYGLNYTSSVHNFFFQYIPMGRKEDFNFGYLGRTSKRLNLFAELKGSLEGNSETLAGFKVKFSDSQVTGFMNSHLKATGIYRKSIQNLLSVSVVGAMDLKNTDKPTRFGMSLGFGAM